MDDSTQLRIDVEGEDELSERLKEITRGISDLSKPMRDVGRYMTDFFSGEVFASRGGIIDEPWAPLSDAYAAEKAEDFPGRPPLFRTGDMNRGFHDKVTSKSVEIYNVTEYFDFIQGGTNRMPARVMMKADQPRIDSIVNIINDYIGRKARA